MVSLILFLDIVEYLESLFFGCGFYHYFLESALKGAVLLDVLTVFIKGGGSDALDFSAGEGRLEHIGCVHGSGGIARSHYRMKFVDEKNYILVFCKLVQNGLYALLELSAVFCAGYDGSHIQGDHALVEEHAAHLALDNAKRKPLHDC